MRRISLFISIFIAVSAFASDPTATSYTFDECCGSLRPYQAPTTAIATPDSLMPVMINHVGRYGSRYPASSNHTYALRSALLKADSLGTITDKGKRLLELTSYVAEISQSYWGALDSLGMAEQRGIASRMFLNYPELFDGQKVMAYSSYSPRCVASMYEFTHQLGRLNNKVEITTIAGRQNSRVLRPFDENADYSDYLRGKVWEIPYSDYLATQINAEQVRRIVGEAYPLTQSEIADLAVVEYYFLAGLKAMNIDVDLSEFLTKEEANAMWSCYNLRQYLQRCATTLSSVPAEITTPLILDIIRTTDDFISGKSDNTAILRFGHAETLLPLLSQLRMKGCYYLTNYFDTVGQHFRDFEIVPMAANLQMILFADAMGNYHVRFDLNEKPIQLIPNDDRIYIPWSEAREYMIHCLPLIDQP